MQGEKREADNPLPDLSEFIKLAKPKRKPCPIGAASDRLNEQQAANLAAACAAATDMVNAGAIVQWLEHHGIAVNVTAVTVHRRGTCRCYDV